MGGLRKQHAAARALDLPGLLAGDLPASSRSPASSRRTRSSPARTPLWRQPESGGAETGSPRTPARSCGRTLLVAALGTAFYMSRLYFLVFVGRVPRHARDAAPHPRVARRHDVPLVAAGARRGPGVGLPRHPRTSCSHARAGSLRRLARARCSGRRAARCRTTAPRCCSWRIAHRARGSARHRARVGALRRRLLADRSSASSPPSPRLYKAGAQQVLRRRALRRADRPAVRAASRMALFAGRRPLPHRHGRGHGIARRARPRRHAGQFQNGDVQRYLVGSSSAPR